MQKEVTIRQNSFHHIVADHYSLVHLPRGVRLLLKEAQMPKYLAQVNYVGEGIKGLLKEGGSSRRAAIEKLFGSVGAKVEALYYAFGDIDLFVIIDAPDNVTAAALSLTVNAAGAATTKVTVLLTPEDIDAAAKKTPSYRPPGK